MKLFWGNTMSPMNDIYQHGASHVEEMAVDKLDQFWLDLTSSDIRHLFRPMNLRISQTGFDRFRLTKEEVDELIKHYCARVGDVRISEYLYSSAVRVSVITIIHGALQLRMIDQIKVDFNKKCLELVRKYDDAVTCWM